MCHPRIGRYNSAAVLPSPATDVLLGASEKSPSRKLLNKAFAAWPGRSSLKNGYLYHVSVEDVRLFLPAIFGSKKGF
jgi:hypothetical protein